MKIRLLNFLLVMLSLPILVSCENKLDGYLKRIDKKSFFKNDPSGWKNFQYIESMDQYMIFKYDGDTLKYLKFIPDENNIPVISQYEMKFPCGLLDTCFLRMQAKDTLFYFKENKDGKEFFVGEYAYRYTSTRMSTEEMDFYENHEDSLRRIKGNNLPKFLK